MIARLVVIAALVSSLQASTAGGRLSFSDLQEFVYDLGDSASVEDGKVRLSGGRWTDSAGGGSTFSLLPIHAMGDLDGDRDADAAVGRRD